MRRIKDREPGIVAAGVSRKRARDGTRDARWASRIGGAAIVKRVLRMQQVLRRAGRRGALARVPAAAELREWRGAGSAAGMPASLGRNAARRSGILHVSPSQWDAACRQPCAKYYEISNWCSSGIDLELNWH
ncbi:hypothetical protein [Burkholderia gladioli]|uniref:hypothetical protein n=1 Tax=Burkholderia gladioli TaxID=28095 RepID=UPI0016407702|nr:hypothetical protein [Burkholderia gladioli]